MEDAERRAPETDEAAPAIPDFTLIRKIGSGGFGAVWLAINRATGQPRAIKLLPRRGAGASRELTSLTRLEAHARQKSPHLLPIHHVGETESHLFYVMDLADDVTGEAPTATAGYQPATLERRLQEGELTPEECIRHARQLLGALASLHQAGMVHRDVKPANCLFVGSELKLADFGLLTDAGPDISRLGTETYMPPDGRMDTRADVYAAGLVIYEMLTGLPVDRFPSLGARAPEILRDPVLSGLVRLCLSACCPRREERFPSAVEMAAALEEVLEPSGPPRPGSTGKRIASFTIAVLLAGGIAVSAILLFRPAHERVDVSFITAPYHDAVVYLDGEPAVSPDGTLYRTPCTVEGVPARPTRVEFRLEGHPTLDAGSIDLAESRQIKASWPSGEDR